MDDAPDEAKKNSIGSKIFPRIIIGWMGVLPAKESSYVDVSLGFFRLILCNDGGQRELDIFLLCWDEKNPHLLL